MSKIITIGRELGSGGRTIGKLVAGKLDIPYYDRDLIDKAAEKTGLTTNYVESTEQKITNSFLYNLAMGTSYAYHILVANDQQNRPLSEQVYIAQQQVITEYAKKGSCVIVGRCADSILSEHSRRLPLLQVVSNDKSFSVGVQSPTEINAPRGCAVILRRICQLTLTRITHQVSRTFDLNLKAFSYFSNLQNGCNVYDHVYFAAMLFIIYFSSAAPGI